MTTWRKPVARPKTKPNPKVAIEREKTAGISSWFSARVAPLDASSADEPKVVKQKSPGKRFSTMLFGSSGKSNMGKNKGSWTLFGGASKVQPFRLSYASESEASEVPRLRNSTATTTTARTSSARASKRGRQSWRGWSVSTRASTRASKRAASEDAAAVQDEQYDVVRELNAHEKMQRSIESMEQSIAKSREKMEDAERAVIQAKVSVEQMRSWVRSMLEDFRMLQHKPSWEHAIIEMCEFAAGLTTKADQPRPTVPPVASEVVRQLESGEPEHSAHASFVLMRQGESNDTLTVVAASPDASAQLQRAKVGAQWGVKSPNALSVEAFEVLSSNEPLLRSPHGTEADARSLAPLRERSGRSFGVLVSGTPALPDEFVCAMARTAGPMLERVWKWAKVNDVLGVAVTWVGKLSDKLTSVKWLEGDSVEAPAETGAKWQPLFHHEGVGDLKLFRLELRWQDMTPLGVLQVQVSKYAEVSESMLQLMHAMAPLLQDTVAEIEAMPVGGRVSLGAHTTFDAAYSDARLMLPCKLQEQMRTQLRSLDSKQVLAELRGYNDVKEDTWRMVAGVLCLLGNDRKPLSSWDAVKVKLTQSVFSEMLDLDLTSSDTTTMRKRWAESQRVTKTVDLDWLLETASYPVQVMAKWLLACRLVHRVVFSIDDELSGDKGSGDTTSAPAAASGAATATDTPRGSEHEESFAALFAEARP